MSWPDDALTPANSGEYLIPFGDSHTGGWWHQLTLSGNITSTGGIATVTSTASGIVPGAWVRVRGCTYAGFNGLFRVLTTPSSTTLTFACPTSAPASETTTGTQAIGISTNQNNSQSYVQYLQAISKARFYMPVNAGVSGENSAQALLRVQREIIANAPSRALILLGTNDAIQATSNDITTFVANMTAIYQQCLNAGIAVDACTIPPFGTGNALVSTVVNVGFISNANRWIREYVARTRGMKLHDIYNWMTDPAQSNGKAKSGYLNADGIHFTSLGCDVVGRAMAANYTAWLGTPADRLPTSQADGYTFDTNSKNRFQNHTFQGAGPVATSWTSAYSGAGNSVTNTTVARTVLADGDTAGQNQKGVLNSTTNTNGVYTISQDPTSLLTVGRTYKGMVAVTITIDANVTQLVVEISFIFTFGGITRTVKAGLQHCCTSGNYVFETPEFIPASAVTSPFFQLRAVTVTPSGTSASEVSWGRAALVQVLPQ